MKVMFSIHVTETCVGSLDQWWPDLPEEEDFRTKEELVSFLEGEILDEWRDWISISSDDVMVKVQLDDHEFVEPPKDPKAPIPGQLSLEDAINESVKAGAEMFLGYVSDEQIERSVFLSRRLRCLRM